MSQTILVTGGAGFIGYHLCKRLLKEKNKVICLDNFSSGQRENIASFLKNPRFTLIEHDVCKPFHSKEKIDQIYNLACPASPQFYQLDPIQTHKTAVLGAINMLEVAKKHKATILQASTSEIYGDPKIHPQPESYFGNVNTVGVRSCYDEGKRSAETLFFDYHRKYQLQIRVVRIFNTYGPYMAESDGRVISNFIYRALKNQDIVIYGDGKQTRSFQYIDDLIKGLLLMMNNKENFIGPVNIGNTGEIAVLVLAKKILKCIPKSKSKLIFAPLPFDDPTRRLPDISLAKKKLGWKPKITLKEGLLKTIKEFQKKTRVIRK